MFSFYLVPTVIFLIIYRSSREISYGAMLPIVNPGLMLTTRDAAMKKVPIITAVPSIASTTNGLGTSSIPSIKEFKSSSSLKDHINYFTHCFSEIQDNFQDTLIKGIKQTKDQWLSKFRSVTSSDKNVIVYIHDAGDSADKIMLQSNRLHGKNHSNTVITCIHTDIDESYSSSRNQEVNDSIRKYGQGIRDVLMSIKKPRSTNLVVYSSGTKLLNTLLDDPKFKGFDNAFLAAPYDLPSNLFSEEENRSRNSYGKKISSLAKKIYIFYNPNDKVLQKQEVDSNVRLIGLHGMEGKPHRACPNVIQIDVQDAARVSDPWTCHEYMSSKFLANNIFAAITEQKD